jgi:hypothetical protein
MVRYRKEFVMKKSLVLLAFALSGSVAAQQATPAASAKPSAQTKSHTVTRPQSVITTADGSSLPIGTAIRIKLETPLSTDRNVRGDRFSGRVLEPVVLNGKTIIPVGSALEGQVIKAQAKRRITGKPTFDLSPDTVTLPDGQRLAIRAAIVDTSNHHLDVNDEGQIKAPGHNRGDWIEMGAGSVVGAGVGAEIGGGKGALIGMTVGAGVSFIHRITRTRNASIPAGTELTMELSRPLQLAASSGD